MGQELFLHPWELRHPLTVPSDPGSGSGTVLSSPPPKQHEPGEDEDISGALQHPRRSCLGAELPISARPFSHGGKTLPLAWGQGNPQGLLGTGRVWLCAVGDWRGKVCWVPRRAGSGSWEMGSEARFAGGQDRSWERSVWGIRPRRQVRIGGRDEGSGARPGLKGDAQVPQESSVSERG